MSFNINIVCSGGQTMIKTNGSNIQISNNYEYDSDSSGFYTSDESSDEEYASSYNENSQDLNDREQNDHYIQDFDKLPLEYYDYFYPENTCPICMCNYIKNEIIRRLPCMHYFHQTCCDEWLERLFQCPVCRSSV